MSSQPVPLLEILRSIGLQKYSFKEYVGKTLGSLNLEKVKQELLSLKIISIKKSRKILHIVLFSDNYPQFFEAHTEQKALVEALSKFFKTTCKIRLCIGK